MELKSFSVTYIHNYDYVLFRILVIFFFFLNLFLFFSVAFIVYSLYLQVNTSLRKCECEVVPMPMHHAIKTHGGSEGNAPLIISTLVL